MKLCQLTASPLIFSIPEVTKSNAHKGPAGSKHLDLKGVCVCARACVRLRMLVYRNIHLSPRRLCQLNKIFL